MRQVIASLLFLALCASCAKQNAAPEVQSLIDAEDSARISIWNPEQVQADTVPHSLFYDSVLKYVRDALPAELEKREAAKELIDAAPLLPGNLKSVAGRNQSLKSMDRFESRVSEADGRIEEAARRFGEYLHRSIDSVYKHDPKQIGAVWPELSRRELFYPSWRPEFDSLERSLIGVSRNLIAFVNSNEAQITFDTVLRFTDASIAHAYDSLKISLTQISAEEAKIAREAMESEKGRAAPPTLAPTKDTIAGRPF